MLKAIIFDFDGIIAHTEPIHLEAFQKTLNDIDIDLCDEEYYEKYIAFDDKTLFQKILKEKGFNLDEFNLEELISVKGDHYNNLILGNIELLPGASEFITKVAVGYPLAIGSGAFKHEILQILEHGGLQSHFKVIVSADDVERSKPAPDVYLDALEHLNRINPDLDIRAENCLVIEDSVAGIEAGLAAGMKCLAITNSYPKEKLGRAHLIKDSLEALSINELEELF